MATQLENQLAEIKQRLDRIEEVAEDNSMIVEIHRRLDAVEKLARNNTPVRGAPGDVSVALKQTAQAVPGLVLKEIIRLRFMDENGNRLPGPAGKDGANGSVGPQGPTPDYETLESVVAHGLHDYGIVSEKDGELVGQYLQLAIENAVEEAVTRALAGKA